MSMYTESRERNVIFFSRDLIFISVEKKQSFF